MILRKTPEELDKIAAAGDILVRCHEILKAKARPGVTTKLASEVPDRIVTHAPAFRRRCTSHVGAGVNVP